MRYQWTNAGEAKRSAVVLKGKKENGLKGEKKTPSSSPSMMKKELKEIPKGSIKKETGNRKCRVRNPSRRILAPSPSNGTSHCY